MKIIKCVHCTYQNYQFIVCTTCLIVFTGTIPMYSQLKFIQMWNIVKQNKHQPYTIDEI